MSTRQYIGARYVPKFFDWNGSAEWRSGVAYEALTIVTRNGNSYTSKIPVPSNIGAPEENPTYWASTGLYNQQIESYRQAVLALDGRVDEAEGDITELGNDITALGTELRGSISALDNELSGEISDVNAEVDTLKNVYGGRKFILLGDSYNSTNHYSWGATVVQRLGLTIGTNAWLVDIPGGGFGREGNLSFLSGLQSVASSLTSDQKLEITDVVIAGGVNDSYATNNEIISGLQACDAFVLANFPNAKYYIICCGWSYQNDNIRGQIINAYNLYNEYNAHAAILNKAFIQFCDPYFLEEDMTHPTQQGNTRLAANIISFINGGNNYNNRYPALQTTFGGITFYGEVTDAGIHIYKNEYGGITLESPATLHRDTPAYIADHIGLSGNNLFERDSVFPIQCTIRRDIDGVTSFLDINALGVVHKYADSLSWAFGIKNLSLVNGSFDINNVTGIYPYFNCYLDFTKN